MSSSSRALTRLENALHQASKGRGIIPVTKDPLLTEDSTSVENLRKKPLIKRPYEEASTDPAKIRRWFRRFPDMNYGIVGAGMIVLDADLDVPAKPEEGWRLSADETLDLVLNDFNLDFDRERHLFTATPSGGLHIFIETPEGITDADLIGSAVQHPNLGRGMDLKNSGGWVMGPGSSWMGKEYVSPDIDAPLVTATPELIAAIRRNAPLQRSHRSQVREKRTQARSSVRGPVLTLGINPRWIARALDDEIAKLEGVSSSQGDRDSQVFASARSIGGLILAEGSGYTVDQGFIRFLAAASHTIGGDWTYADVQQKWARAVGSTDSSGQEWAAEAEIRTIPAAAPKASTKRKTPKIKAEAKLEVEPAAPARKRGRPRKENPAEKNYAWAWALDGSLDRPAVEEFLIKKHHIKVDAEGFLWYYEPTGIYKQLTKVEGQGAPRRTMKAILGNRYTTTAVNNIISGILEERDSLELLDTARSLANAHLVHLRNGLLNTRTHQFEPHTHSNASIFQLPITYDPDAISPEWDKQLSFMLPSDSQDYVLQMMASVVLPTAKSASMWMLGTKSNSGKSFLMEFIRDYLIGSRFTSDTAPHLLNSDSSHLLAGVRGKYAIICAELQGRKLVCVEELKKLMSGGRDSIQAHAKFKDAVSFTWFGSMIFSTNNEIEVSDKSGAWDRRMKYLNFPYVLEQRPGAQKDWDSVGINVLYTDREVSGLFNKIVAAAQQIEEHGFSIPESAVRMRREFETPIESRPIVKWLHEEEGVTLDINLQANRDTPTSAMKVRRSAAYKAFMTWSTANGQARESLISRNAFYAVLSRTFGQPVHLKEGDHFIGLSLTASGRRSSRARAVRDDLEVLASEVKADIYSGEISEVLVS
jgi:P4 family phage/plasmid primase-like protien